MFATSMRAPTWPAHLSFLAAGLFTLASGGTNLFYGIAKGTDAASSLVWATVSIGVSIIFALSWPAFIVSLDRRQWARAALVLIALFLTGTYSVTAALRNGWPGKRCHRRKGHDRQAHQGGSRLRCRQGRIGDPETLAPRR
jgi:hypothetical protein